MHSDVIYTLLNMGNRLFIFFIFCVLISVHFGRSQHAGAPLLACGFSLGANILAKYVGEEGERCPLVAAAVVSNPYDLLGSNEMMHSGLGPIYDRVLCQVTLSLPLSPLPPSSSFRHASLEPSGKMEM